MSVEINISLKGGILKTFKKLGGGKQQLEGIVDGAGLDALSRAKLDAPKVDSRLVGSITLEPEPGSTTVKVLRANVFYSPYVEFGTGTRVFKASGKAKNSTYRFSTEQRNYARQFKKTKATVGMEARPFLFVNAERAQRAINEDFIKFIEDAAGIKLR